MLEDLNEEDLRRTVSHFGPDYSISLELRTHSLHLAGHRYQTRSILGTYSRAFSTDKSEFDPW